MTLRQFCLVTIFVLSSWAGSASAALLPSVTVNGVEWLQPLDFVSLGWNTISTVCDPDSGACNGMLGGHDVTGWTWGGVDAVLAMTSAFTGAPPGELTAGVDSVWAPLFLQSFFATEVDPNRSMVSGIVRERQFLSDGIVFYGTIFVSDGYRSPFVDRVTVIPVGTPPESQPTLGAWLYRDPSNIVPVPATLALFAFSLAILAYSCRRGIYTKDASCIRV